MNDGVSVHFPYVQSVFVSRIRDVLDWSDAFGCEHCTHPAIPYRLVKFPPSLVCLHIFQSGVASLDEHVQTNGLATLTTNCGDDCLESRSGNNCIEMERNWSIKRMQ